MALFNDDGVFENSRNHDEGPVIVAGKQALSKYFSRVKPARRVPLMTNEATTIDADEAQGNCAMLSMGYDGFCGHYIDHFSKLKGQWLFRRRQFFPYWPVYKPSAECLPR